MDPRKSRPRDDLPRIGDYSGADRARPRDPARPAPPAPPRAASAAAPRARDDAFRLDPSDMRRHTQRLRQRQRKGPLARLWPYGALAVAAAAAFGIYWNFDALQGMEIGFRSLRSPAAARPSPGLIGNDRPPADLELETEAFEAPAIVGETAPVVPPGAEPPAAAADPAPAVAPAADDSSASAALDSPPLAAAVEAGTDEPPAGPAPPPPPPEPGTFVLGLPTLEVSEGDAAVALLILRNGDTSNESFIRWWTSPGTATPGVDYVDMGEVDERFPRGAQNRTIRIPIIGDRIAEGPETFYIHLAPSPAGAVPADRLRTEVTIVDDD